MCRSTVWQSGGGNRTSRRCFFSRGVSIMSSVRQAESSALLPNPTWAEARPICQAETISLEPSRNKLLSFPTVKPYEAAGLRAGNRDATDSWCYTGKRRWRREISNTLIYADGADGQPLLCSSSSCTQSFNETINSKERKKKSEKKHYFCFFGFQALGWAALISHPHFS